MKLHRAACACLAVAVLSAALTPEAYLAQVRYLASPELKGRGDTAPELDRAARYIAGQFRSFHLQPPPGSGYFQPFRFTTHARLGRRNALTLSTAARLQADFLPLNLSATGAFAAPLAFAGYGITAPEYHYDDYASLDVRGRFVIVLRHEPQEFDPDSPFDGRVYTGHSQLAVKVANARRHGAAGLILVPDSAAHSGSDFLEGFSPSNGPGDAGIACIQARAALVDTWLAPAGHTLDALQCAIDRQRKPQSFLLPAATRLRLRVDLHRTTRRVRNVAAYLPGRTPEYVIVGAHYDHLGLGNEYSLSPGQIGTPHPGADDNASGTAGLLELARELAAGPPPTRGILFLAFAAEEFGMLGSIHYTNSPALPLSNAVAMINLDMIGRLRDNRVYVGASPPLTSLLEELRARYRLNLDYSPQMVFGASDHTSFAARQVPHLFFFTGLHDDYHRPADTWDKITGPDTVRLLNLVADLTRRLATP